MIINYRGSTGYGEDFFNALISNVGVTDVDDCGHLIQKTLTEFPNEIDSKRVSVYGGSHGGFLIGHLIGHPEFKELFKAAAVRNPVLDFNYMLASTDIPDWIYGCCLNRDMDFATPSE